MKKVILILPFLFSITTQTKACDDVNLFVSNPRVMETKIVNQGDWSTCYAHSLGALYSMEVASNQEEALHPYWVAYNHKQRFIHWSPRNLNYSMLSWAYSDIRKNGVCPYNLIEERLKAIKRGVPYSNDQVLYMIKAFLKKKNLRLITINSQFNKVLDSAYEFLLKDSKKFEIPWSKADMETILRPLKNKLALKNFFGFLGSDVFRDCDTYARPTDAKLHNFGRAFESNTSVEAQLQNALSEEKAVAIGYCPTKVYKEGWQNEKDLVAFPRIARSFVGSCGAHYSLLVGSRKQGNSCQLLLRNSYGQGFWGGPGMQYWCQDKITGQQRNCTKEENNPNLKVLAGWVDSKKMAANTYDVSFFE